MRNKFVYSCSIKIYALGFNKLLESIFCLLLVMEAFSLQEVVKMLEGMVVVSLVQNKYKINSKWASLVAQLVKKPPAMQGTQV